MSCARIFSTRYLHWVGPPSRSTDLRLLSQCQQQLLVIRHYSASTQPQAQELPQGRIIRRPKRSNFRFGAKRRQINLTPTAPFETLSGRISFYVPPEPGKRKHRKPKSEATTGLGALQKSNSAIPYVEKIDKEFLSASPIRKKARLGKVLYNSLPPPDDENEPTIVAVEEFNEKKSSRLQVVLRLRGEFISIPFDTIFLRDSCSCSLCVDPSTRQKNFQTTDIPYAINARQLSFTGNGNLRVYWSHDIPGTPSWHHSCFSADFLATYANVSSRALHARYNDPPRTYWNSAMISANIDNLWFDYNNYLHSDESLYAALKNLQEYGLVFLNNVPLTEDAVEHIGQRIGPLRDTFYGRTWDVRSVPDAKNVAYTHQYLGLHMDLLYMAQPPELQILHSLRSSSTGGESLFSDTFYAAQILHDTDPDQFKYLTRYPVTYHYRNAGEHYHYSRPTIELERRELYTPSASSKDVIALLKARNQAEAKVSDTTSSFPISSQSGSEQHPHQNLQSDSLLYESSSSSSAVNISDDPEALEALEAAKALSTLAQSSPSLSSTASSSSPPSSSPRPQIAHINYSPPFQAPFELLSGSSLRHYLYGASRFSRLLASPENLFELRLEQGQAVIFNNRRVVHGRRAFDVSSGERWLKGAYVDVDPFRSRYRVLRERFEPWKP